MAKKVVLGIRPESFEDAAFAALGLPTIEVDVVVVEELGSDAHVFFPIDAPRITPEAIEAEGEDGAQLVADEVALLNARVDPRTAARVNTRMTVAVDPARFHFFDPETGASLLEHPARAEHPGHPGAETPEPVPVAQQT